MLMLIQPKFHIGWSKTHIQMKWEELLMVKFQPKLSHGKSVYNTSLNQDVAEFWLTKPQ